MWICEVEGLSTTMWEAWNSYGLGMVTALKNNKKLRFARYGPFSHVLPHIWLCQGG